MGKANGASNGEGGSGAKPSEEEGLCISAAYASSAASAAAFLGGASAQSPWDGLATRPFPAALLTDFLDWRGAEGEEEKAEKRSWVLAELASEATRALEAGGALFAETNDLFRFTQSPDLTKLSESSFPLLSHFRHFVYTAVREWLGSACGLALSETRTALSVSRYGPGDYLLSHDDQLERRLVAFVFYLPEEWAEEQGGALALRGAHGQDQELRCGDVQRRLHVKPNSFSFFPVSQRSFHEVEEVLRGQRLSINGWFHADEDLPRPAVLPLTDALPSLLKPKALPSSRSLADFVNPLYLQPRIQEKIRQLFYRHSQVLLPDFLEESVYEGVVREELEKAEWTEVGPANQRRHGLSDSSLGGLKDLLISAQMAALLQRLTKVPLERESEDEAWEEEADEEVQRITAQRAAKARAQIAARKAKRQQIADLWFLEDDDEEEYSTSEGEDGPKESEKPNGTAHPPPEMAPRFGAATVPEFQETEPSLAKAARLEEAYAADVLPAVRVAQPQLQRFAKGDYSLARPESEAEAAWLERRAEAAGEEPMQLDVSLFLRPKAQEPRWPEDAGGELVVAEDRSNWAPVVVLGRAVDKGLLLAYRASSQPRFVRRVGHRAGDASFAVLHTAWYEEGGEED